MNIYIPLEFAQEQNLDDAEQELFYPSKPWACVNEFETKENDYQNQLQKSHMIAEHVNTEEKNMIEDKINQGELL
jgi:hypothetical protein